MTETASDPDGTGVVSREIATTLVETGAGYVARAGDMVLWAEPPPGRIGADGLDAAVVGLRDIAAQRLPGGQTTARISTLFTDVRLGELAGLAAVVPTNTGMVSVAYGWGVVTGVDPASGTRTAGNDATDGPDGTGGTVVAGGATVQQVHLNHEFLAVGRRDVTDRVSLPELHHQPASAGLVQGVVPGGAALVATRLTLGETGRSSDPAGAGTDAATDSVIDIDAAVDADGPATAEPTADGPTGAGPGPAAPAGAGPPETDPTATAGAPDNGSGPSSGDHNGDGDIEVIATSGPRAPLMAQLTSLPPAGRGTSPATLRTPGAEEVIIEGVQCLRGHLNDPIALHCATCAVSMIQRRGDRIRAVRPPLGLLVLDDGSTYAVAAPLIVGTAPDRADAVVERRAWDVPLVDPAGEIEALHAEFRLTGWEVQLVDWSTRGTFLLPPDGTTWDVAPRGVPTTLGAGTRIGLGGRVATFTTGAGLRSN